MDIKIDVSGSFVSSEAIEACRDEQEDAQERMWSGKEAFTGWVKLPLDFDRDLLDQILMTADRIQEQCELLIVIGIGGSYIGTKAVIEALSHTVVTGAAYDDAMPIVPPEVKFAGCNMSAAYHSKLINEIRNRETCLCVVSKAGDTIETGMAFYLLKEAMVKKYGAAGAAKRIYAVTDAKEGAIREEADREEYISFDIPEDVGGRYSVLTPAGLLPIAAAGIDIKELLAGAEAMASSTAWDFSAPDYACVRYLLWRGSGLSGQELVCGKKSVEIFEYYEPQLAAFAEWLKQLFGESEGKDGKGIFPASLAFCTDLHSMGQFLQEGSRIFFETVINIIKPPADLKIPAEAGELLSGKSMNRINEAAMKGVISAHQDAGVPIIRIDVPELSPFYIGQLIYFFEATCGISAYMMGVEPFCQPGVEKYKSEMHRELKNLPQEE